MWHGHHKNEHRNRLPERKHEVQLKLIIVTCFVLLGPKLRWQDCVFLGTQPLKSMVEELDHDWGIEPEHSSTGRKLEELKRFRSKSTVLKWVPSDGLFGGRGFQVDSSKFTRWNEDPRVEIAVVVSAQPQFPRMALSRNTMGCIYVPCKILCRSGCLCVRWSVDVSCAGCKAGQGGLWSHLPDLGV